MGKQEVERKLIFNKNKWETSLLLIISNILFLREWIDINEITENMLSEDVLISKLKKMILFFILKRYSIEMKVVYNF